MITDLITDTKGALKDRVWDKTGKRLFGNSYALMTNKELTPEEEEASKQLFDSKINNIKQIGSTVAGAAKGLTSGISSLTSNIKQDKLLKLQNALEKKRLNYQKMGLKETTLDKYIEDKINKDRASLLEQLQSFNLQILQFGALQNGLSNLSTFASQEAEKKKNGNNGAVLQELRQKLLESPLGSDPNLTAASPQTTAPATPALLEPGTIALASGMVLKGTLKKNVELNGSPNNVNTIIELPLLISQLKHGGYVKKDNKYIHKHIVGGLLMAQAALMGVDATAKALDVGTNLNNTISTAMGELDAYSGRAGKTAVRSDMAFDTISNTVADGLSAIPVVGKLGSGITKFASSTINLGNKLFNKVGAGTSGMTKFDAFSDSVFGKAFLGPFSLINGFAGKKSHELNDLLDLTNFLYGDNAMSGFAGTTDAVNNTMLFSNKKYGLFSSKARKKANSAIDTLNQLLNQILDIAASASDAFDILNSMASVNENKAAFDLNGGYKLGAIHVGRVGMKIIPINKILSAKRIAAYKRGKDISLQSKKSLETPAMLWKKGLNTYEDFLKYYSLTRGSSPKTKEYNFKRFYEDKDTFNDWLLREALNFGKAHFPDLYKTPEHITYSRDSKDTSKEAGTWIGNDTEGWTFIPSPWQMAKWGKDAYIKYFKDFEPDSRLMWGNEVLQKGNLKLLAIPTTPEIFEFKQGGQMNVIPEGALHARLHHMEEGDKITKKGIPVVDMQGNLLAEIERNEIILNLELTQKLEELCKLYKESKDGNLALEAGKLLADEIINNTDDRTGLMEEIK